MKIFKHLSWVSVFVSILALLGVYAITIRMFPQSDKYIPPTHVHKVLYLDRRCNEEKVQMITQAAQEWTEATHHIAEFTIVQLPTKEPLNIEEGIVISLISEDSPDILLLENFDESAELLGYYNNKGIIAQLELVDDRLTDKNYKATVLHELGHALGLQHNKTIDGIGTLMFEAEDFGSNTITPYDVASFCKLYNCKSKH